MAKEEQKAFLIERDQKEIIDELTDEEAGIIFKAIFEYVDTKEVPILEKTLRIVFKQFKNKLDFFEEKYEQKCLKNKENIEKYWKEKKEKENNINEYERIQSNTNVYKIKEKEKINKNKSKIKIKEKENKNKIKNINISLMSGQFASKLPDSASQLDVSCNQVIAHLNEKTNSKYSAKADSNKRLIKSLLNDYSVEDIIMVIDKMCFLWGNEPKRGEKDMRLYLRPSTLFRKSNFENYFGMNVPQKKITTADIVKNMDFSDFR